jgi:adenosylcobinamide-phosphate synthase
MDWYSTWYILPSAFMFDLILGDPRCLPHPVRWMGRAIEAAEPRFRRLPGDPIIAGGLFAASLVAGTWLLVYWLLAALNHIHPLLKNALEIVLIYYCISAGSLEEAAVAVKRCLSAKDITAAREKVALIVGRDVTNYQATDIARAAVETVAENLVDGVISPLFFAAIGGAPLAMAYKMVNTLDSMVGYKNEKYQNFGQAAARIDDVLNYIPSRFAVPIISLATHILCGKGRRSLETAVREGANHSSPNAGFPEAAFAGALGVKLNGPNYYAGKLVDKPYIGINFGPSSPVHIEKACDIMLLSSFLWLMVMWVASLALK